MTTATIPGLNIPVHSVFCIGKNYELHARELGSTPPPIPMMFLKPITTICTTGSIIQLPSVSDDVHHEVELVIALGSGGKNIPESEALNHVAGFGVGVDFTARDLQQQAKEKGHPWALSKGFDGFGPVGNFIPYEGQNLQNLNLELKVNDETRQSGSTSDMIFNIQTLISYLSQHFTLSEGDLIFTGTPEGVSAVRSGDTITATLNAGQSSLKVDIK